MELIFAYGVFAAGCALMGIGAKFVSKPEQSIEMLERLGVL
jgi:hypothetical protein